MSDKHLNLFYSYRRDSDLIEDNLTRAFIVTIRLLSQDLRQMFLFHLLNEPLTALGVYEDVSLPSYRNVKFALQNNIDKQKVLSCHQKYLVALTGNYIEDLESGEEAYKSRPDAWIYDPDEEGGYIFLFEAKIGGNVLDARQLKSHADSWLGIQDYRRFLITVTWYDVIRAIEKISSFSGATEGKMNQQEREILEALKQYLGYAGYRLFKGFNFDHFQDPPIFRIARHRPLFRMKLRNPPKFIFGK